MIKNIFIPERVGSYYIFSKRIIGFDVNRTSVHATQLYLSRRSMVIEKFFEEKIENNVAIPYHERAAQAIKAIMARADQCNEVHTAISSSVAVFKELTLPFLEAEKIRKVLNFEVEPLLPFPLATAVVDFIITKQNLAEKSSNVLVAAVQKEQLVQHLQLFASAGIDPDVVTVDLFALYSLYAQIPEYAQEEGAVALIDVGLHVTRIAFIYEKQLKFVRTLSRGLLAIAKSLSDELNSTPAEAMEMIMRFGLAPQENNSSMTALTKIMTNFWSEVDFTLRSFATQVGQPSANLGLLLGPGAEVKELCPFIATLLALPCKLFSISTLLRNKEVALASGMQGPRIYFVSLATVYPTAMLDQFNIRRDEFAISDMGLFKKQIAVTSCLLLMLVGFMIFFMSWELRSLRVEEAASEDEAVAAIKTRFPKVQGTGLTTVVNNANTQLAMQEQALGFLSPTRASYLLYLLELTTKIEREAVGFDPDRITIDNDLMTVEAHVRGYEEIKKLEKGLRESKLFKFAPIEKTDFTLKIRLLHGKEL